jgi:hypothetical protein
MTRRDAMKASGNDHLNRKIPKGKGVLEEIVDENVLEAGSEEVEGTLEDTNKQVAKTFKHLGKSVEIKF